MDVIKTSDWIVDMGPEGGGGGGAVVAKEALRTSPRTPRATRAFPGPDAWPGEADPQTAQQPQGQAPSTRSMGSKDPRGSL